MSMPTAYGFLQARAVTAYFRSCDNLDDSIRRRVHQLCRGTPQITAHRLVRVNVDDLLDRQWEQHVEHEDLVRHVHAIVRVYTHANTDTLPLNTPRTQTDSD